MAGTLLESFLPVAFRAFLLEVGRVEREIRHQLSLDAATRAEDGLPPAADLRQELAELLDKQASDATAKGSDPKSPAFQQAQNLMAKVADAKLTSFEWWGRNSWLEQPLAAAYPLPDGVPEELDEQLQQLLSADSPNTELAQIYLLALACEAFVEIDAASYRKRLLKVLRVPFPELADEPQRLFPEAYQRRQQRGAAAMLPAVRQWLVAVLVLAGILMIVAAPLWLRATAVARQAVQQILSAESAE